MSYRELIAKRNAAIVDMWESGLSKQFIAEQWNMKIREVRGVIRRATAIIIEVTFE